MTALIVHMRAGPCPPDAVGGQILIVFSMSACQGTYLSQVSGVYTISVRFLPHTLIPPICGE